MARRALIFHRASPALSRRKYCIEKEEKNEQKQPPRWDRTARCSNVLPRWRGPHFFSPRCFRASFAAPLWQAVPTTIFPGLNRLYPRNTYSNDNWNIWSNKSQMVKISLGYIIIFHHYFEKVRITLAFALSKMAVFSFIGNYPISLSIRPGKFACHEYQRRSGSKTPCACYLNLRFLIRTLGEILSSIYHRIECIFSLFNEYEEFLLEFKSVVSFSVLHF